jgi:CBS-domain-containing membrane protein
MAMQGNSPNPARMVLEPLRAADLMSANVISVRAEATVSEAITVLTGRGFRAAPVIEESGRPVGVLSRADVLVHEREELALGATASADPTRVRDIMTPVVFSVTPQTGADKVVEQMLELNVQQLFVVDQQGEYVVGVITTLDVLRRLQREQDDR